MTSHIVLHARRIVVGGTSGLFAFAGYKSQFDPVHIFWDLDHTILCSISPIPDHGNEGSNSIPKQNNNTSSKCPVAPSNVASLLLPPPPKLNYFDQIDDDFPYDDRSLTPNTRTYFRPGAQLALKLCNIFGTIHVYTAAQESYTNNIVNDLKNSDYRIMFQEVLHRDAFPLIVSEGKDLNVAGDRYNLQRSILFDDKQSNFRPQNYENGIAVAPFTPERVQKIRDGSWIVYLEELKEMSRLVGIAFWSSTHFSGDARRVVAWVRGGWKDSTQ